MRRAGSERLTPEQMAELQALATMPDAEIDTHDVPEQRDWSGGERGAFLRPVERRLTLRIDADLVTWFEVHASDGEDYQAHIDRALRAYVDQHRDE